MYIYIYINIWTLEGSSLRISYYTKANIHEIHIAYGTQLYPMNRGTDKEKIYHEHQHSQMNEGTVPLADSPPLNT